MNDKLLLFHVLVMLLERKALLQAREDGNHVNKARVCVQIQQVYRGSPVE